MEQFEEKIRAALDEVRPGLQNDGGDVELVSVDGKTVTLQLTGHCGSCPYAMMTLKNGIENYLREQVDPEITVVRAE
ncbi:MAG: NifU family protein [Victivallales bacterium]|nr:NifU family protein [Victivallales bacterium]